MASYNDDEFNSDHNRLSGPVIITIAVVSGIILFILLIVLANNKTVSGKNNLKNTLMMAQNDATEAPGSDLDDISYGDSKDIEKLYKDGKLRASDFDFWDMYSDNDTPVYISPSADPENSDSSGDGSAQETSDEENPAESASPSPSPEPGDELIEDVKENTLDYTNIRIIDNKMEYYLNGSKVSTLGVDISEKNGVVDFGMLKNNGIDFVMLRVGTRGYDSGVINEDKLFDRNLQAAKEADLGIGLYFLSRAVNEEEAIDEAKFCLLKAEDAIVKYPIAFCFEGELVDDSRTDILDEEAKTKIADAFLTTVLNNGYNGTLCGTQDYILNDVLPEKLLTKYDVYLIDQNLISEYPYQFKLWKYTADLTIPGIENGGQYIISFADYQNR